MFCICVAACACVRFVCVFCVCFLCVFFVCVLCVYKVIRSTAAGGASMAGRLGGIATSFVSMALPLEQVMITFGVTSLICVFCVAFLPETKHLQLEDFVETSINEKTKLNTQIYNNNNINNNNNKNYNIHNNNKHCTYSGVTIQ